LRRLADTLTVVYGQDLNSLLFDRVFTPLGINTGDLSWRSHAYRDDTINGIKRREFGSGISVNVDAMARLGYFYLRRGRWESQQILPGSFINELSTIVPEVAGLPIVGDALNRFAGAPQHYGILWWNNADGSIPDLPLDAYWAWGLNESLIVVIPSLDIVASRQGQAWSGSHTPSFYQVLAPFLSPLGRSIAAAATCRWTRIGVNGRPDRVFVLTEN
jgi:CubicO group peptidase (beta-lactamase class C family)